MSAPLERWVSCSRRENMPVAGRVTGPEREAGGLWGRGRGIGVERKRDVAKREGDLLREQRILTQKRRQVTVYVRRGTAEALKHRGVRVANCGPATE